jgi:hypothetical protein
MDADSSTREEEEAGSGIPIGIKLSEHVLFSDFGTG